MSSVVSARALAAGAAGVAAGALLTRFACEPDARLRLALRLGATMGDYVLRNARVPASLLPPSYAAWADAEGLVHCDVRITRGAVAGISVAGTERGIGVEMRGCIVVACFVDAHTHLVKTHAHPRARNPTGSINDALATELEDQPRWAACACCRPDAMGGGADNARFAADGGPCENAVDVRRRMDFALATAYSCRADTSLMNRGDAAAGDADRPRRSDAAAGDADRPRRSDAAAGDAESSVETGARLRYHHGCRAIRTHLDGTNSEDPRVAATVYAAFVRCRDAWKRRGLFVQGVANLYLPLWAGAFGFDAEAFADEAASHEDVVLGAYCGNLAETPEDESEAHFRALLEHARTRKLPVDLHVDETNDARSRGVAVFARALQAARAKGYSEPVILGHATALALQPDAVAISASLAGLGCTVVCNPSTNLGLQDRRGSAPPHNVPIDRSMARTPRWRGLTCVQELKAAGVAVAAASDNVRDWWHPYGDYDGVEVWRNARRRRRSLTFPRTIHVPGRGVAATLPPQNAPAGGHAGPFGYGAVRRRVGGRGLGRAVKGHGRRAS